MRISLLQTQPSSTAKEHLDNQMYRYTWVETVNVVAETNSQGIMTKGKEYADGLQKTFDTLS